MDELEELKHHPRHEETTEIKEVLSNTEKPLAVTENIEVTQKLTEIDEEESLKKLRNHNHHIMQSNQKNNDENAASEKEKAVKVRI